MSNDDSKIKQAHIGKTNMNVEFPFVKAPLSLLPFHRHAVDSDYKLYCVLRWLQKSGMDCKFAP